MEDWWWDLGLGYACSLERGHSYSENFGCSLVFFLVEGRLVHGLNTLSCIERFFQLGG